MTKAIVHIKSTYRSSNPTLYTNVYDKSRVKLILLLLQQQQQQAATLLCETCSSLKN